MKQHLWKGIVAAVCMLLLTGASASAQMVGPEKEMARFTVPFAFTVDETRFDAGEYVIDQFAEKTSNEMVIYPTDDADKRETFIAEQIVDHNYLDADDTELVFDRIDGERHLAEVWIANKGAYRVGTVAADDRVAGELRLNDPEQQGNIQVESVTEREPLTNGDDEMRAADSDWDGKRHHEMKDEDEAKMSADLEPNDR